MSSGLTDVLRGWSFWPLDNVEFHRIAFSESLEAAPLNGAVVHEAILRAVVRGNEAETLRVVEPLHFAGRTHSSLRGRTLVEGVGTRRALTVVIRRGTAQTPRARSRSPPRSSAERHIIKASDQLNNTGRSANTFAAYRAS